MPLRWRFGRLVRVHYHRYVARSRDVGGIGGYMGVLAQKQRDDGVN